MPGFDGTGPRGEGPMTGGGRGYCVVPASGITRPAGRFSGRGGRGRRNQYYATGLTGWQRDGLGYPVSSSGFIAGDELETLKMQAGSLAAQLKEIQTRIGEIEQAQDKKKKR